MQYRGRVLGDGSLGTVKDMQVVVHKETKTASLCCVKAEQKVNCKQNEVTVIWSDRERKYTLYSEGLLSAICTVPEA